MRTPALAPVVSLPRLSWDQPVVEPFHPVSSPASSYVYVVPPGQVFLLTSWPMRLAVFSPQ